MNTKDFEYIVEIARQESISKAAARLYLSQPTLTKFLQKVEAEFGTPLFDRIGKKMIPTAAGKCCIEKAERILELNDQMNKNVQALCQSDRGMIRVGISASRGEFFIHRIFPKMTRKYPNVSFYLVVEAKRDLQKKLEDDEIDVMFTSNYAERPDLEYTRIAQEEMVLVVPADHELLSKAVKKKEFRYPYVPVEDWIKYPFVTVASRLTTGQYTRLLFQHYQEKPVVQLEVGSVPLVYSAVSQRIGIAIVPSMLLISEEYRDLKYLSFDDAQNIQWYFAAITKRDKSLHPAVREMIEIARNEYS